LEESFEMKRAIKALFLGLIATFLLAYPALAQNVQAPVTSREQRVGVDPSNRVPLTMREAISMALESNRDIEIERLNVQMNEFDFRGAKGIYDPIFLATVYYDWRNAPCRQPARDRTGWIGPY
jgi:hypothetical protein